VYPERPTPVVGEVMRERTFSRVLLPAPFRPMIPTMSPRSTSKFTSFSAQNSRASTWPPVVPPRLKMDCRPWLMLSRIVPCERVAPSV
jgi:hypothetical protein